MNNFKSTKFIGALAPMGFFLPDEMTQFRVLDRFPKFIQFEPLTFRGQFHPAIRQIADRSGYFKTAGQRFDREPKSNTLHPARIENLQTMPFHIPLGSYIVQPAAKPCPRAI